MVQNQGASNEMGEEGDEMDDMISRKAVINEMKDMYTAAEEWAQGAHDDDTKARAESCMATNVELKLRIEKLPSAQPEIIHCCDCIYYDPEHIEKNGVRYEYRDMPKDAFDSLGTGLVNSEYGINVGGRCCRDYNAGYSEDKRVFVSGQNYCGRAGRKEDE